MKVAGPGGVLELETCIQRFGEQVMVAVPPPLVVERDNEEVLPLERLEHPLTVGPSGQGITQLTGQLVENAGVEQELPHVVGLAVQDFFDQVVEDEAVAPGEGVDEPGDGSGRGLAAGAGRQCRQLEPGCPAFGPRAEGCDVLRLELEAHDLVEEGTGLLRR